MRLGASRYQAQQHHGLLARNGSRCREGSGFWFGTRSSGGVRGFKDWSDINAAGDDPGHSSVHVARASRWVTRRLRELSESLTILDGPSGDCMCCGEPAQAYPDQQDRILALFAWFGSGAGPWLGCPAYEQTPEYLLLQESVEELVDVLQSQSLSEEELEGAARFFAGTDFAKHVAGEQTDPLEAVTDTQMAVFHPSRSGEPAPILIDLRRRLAAHCQKSSDEDKRSRAESAFAIS